MEVLIWNTHLLVHRTVRHENHRPYHRDYVDRATLKPKHMSEQNITQSTTAESGGPRARRLEGSVVHTRK